MRVPFTKMHGLGNDYVYFDCVRNPGLVPAPAAVAPRLSDRHCGIGGDGIVLILPHAEADFQMRMFNADGSEAEMCGNAIRCVGKLVYDRGYRRGETVRIMTGNGIRTLALTVAGGVCTHARVAMGEPKLAGPQIPIALDQPRILGAPISVAGASYAFTGVSMGNPHCVIFVDEITDQQVLQHGPLLETHTLFPRRINVEFVKVLNRREVRMRVWERGSGETMACGTGACAVGVACVLNGHTDRDVTVHLRGGDLRIQWDERDGQVYMTGPATHVFDGEVEL
jgi:diaminopimelate epimerase